MREIIYKAKRRDNHEWIIGYYCKYGDNHCIIEPTEFGLAKGVGIIPETLCEFTGLHDKNGKRIWENDIVRELGYEPQVAVVKFGNGYYDGGIYPFVGWYYQYPNDENIDGQALYERVAREDFEVIGNSIDNPNLLTERVTTNDE